MVRIKLVKVWNMNTSLRDEVFRYSRFAKQKNIELNNWEGCLPGLILGLFGNRVNRNERESSLGI